MARTISQDTFNNAVKENINDFGMSIEDAVKNAFEQFSDQGVDLDSIDAKCILNVDRDVLLSSIEKLRKFADNATDDVNAISETISLLELVREECKMDLGKRIHAGNAGLMNILLSLMKPSERDKNVIKAAHETMLALMTAYPDILSDAAIETFRETVRSNAGSDILLPSFKWLTQACFKNEKNRQNICSDDFAIELAAVLTNSEQITKHLLKAACDFIFALLLDDDARQPFSERTIRGHTLSTHTLELLLRHATRDDVKNDPEVISNMLKTLCSMIQSEIWCSKFDQLEGLPLIGRLLEGYINHREVSHQCLNAVRTFSRSEAIRQKILEHVQPDLVVEAISRYHKSPKVFLVGLSAIICLCLRSRDNSLKLWQCSAPQVIMKSIKIYHPADKVIARRCCSAIYNMSVRVRECRNDFITRGAPEFLRSTYDQHDDLHYDVNIALRSLGLLPLECQKNDDAVESTIPVENTVQNAN